MMKIRLTILYLLLTCTGYSNTFQINSIGVVYLNSTTDDKYELTFVFPMSSITEHDNYDNRLDNVIVDTMTFNNDIVLFNNKGVIGTIKYADRVYIHFWCENDGGIQFRPEIKIMVNKNEIKDELQSNPELQNLTCFAIINYDRTKLKKVEHEQRFNLEMEGDIDYDGINEIEIYSFLDDAENCDGLPDNNLVVFQKTGNRRNFLRCCGP